MQDVYIIGVGQTPIGEWWDRSLSDLSTEALREAMADAGIEEQPDALFVSNMLAGQLSKQKHLGALISSAAGWDGIEALVIEAACGSGGAAVQAGITAIRSGAARMAAVVGVEKMTDGVHGETITAGLATAADAEYEVDQGASFVALNALVMARYMHEYGIDHEAFGGFSINAHANATNNPCAMFRSPITQRTYAKAPMIAPPVNLLDSSPVCDGAAALILASADGLRDLPQADPVRVLASASATDTISLQERRNLIELDGARLSTQRAYEQAGLAPQDIDLFEAHDAFSIMAALSLEAAGFAQPGRATMLAREGEITPDGRIPISTMGGLKARGHPVGATGVYQIVELVSQLRGQAGANQVLHAEIGMAQNIGGSGATVITHILSRG